MIDPRTETIIRVKVLDEENNVNAIFDCLEKKYPEISNRKISSFYSIDYLENCIMIDSVDIGDLIDLSTWFPKAIFYGVIAWKDTGEYRARQVVASNGKAFCVSDIISLGYDLEDAKTWNIGNYMHLYGTTDAVEAGRKMYGLKEEEDRMGD